MAPECVGQSRYQQTDDDPEEEGTEYQFIDETEVLVDIATHGPVPQEREQQGTDEMSEYIAGFVVKIQDRRLDAVLEARLRRSKAFANEFVVPIPVRYRRHVQQFHGWAQRSRLNERFNL